MNMNDYKKVVDRISPSERCREEVLNMRSENNRRKIKRKPTGRIIAVIAVAAIAACGGTVAAASGLGAFDRLANKKDRTITYDNGYVGPIDKFDDNDYEKISPHAVQFEEVSKASNDYFTVELDSAYFDGTELILGFTGEIADGNVKALSSLRFTSMLEINGERVMEARPDKAYMPYWGGCFVIDEGTDNSFTGSMTCVLPYSARFDDTAEVTLKINNIWSNEILTYSEREQRPYSYEVMPHKKENILTLSANVTADTGLIKQINKTVEQDGFSLTVYSMSPAMMLVNTSYPESYDIAIREEIENGTSDGHCHAVHPVAFLFDEDGNYIAPLGFDPVQMADGKWASASLPTDSKTITMKVGDKNCTSNELGSIEFDNKYGHQSFGYITELTLDLYD